MTIEMRGCCPLLSVYDMPTAIHFYCDVLGFEIHTTSAREPGGPYGWAWLRHAGGAELMLNTAYDDDERPGVPDSARIAAHIDTCLYFGGRNLDQTWEHLRAHGVDAEKPAVAWYGMRQLYVRDPDGYNLCFQHRQPSEVPAVASR